MKENEKNLVRSEQRTIMEHDSEIQKMATDGAFKFFKYCSYQGSKKSERSSSGEEGKKRKYGSRIE